MANLAPALRKTLVDAVKEARDVAEAGARAALEQLAVYAPEPFAHLTPDDRELRNRLRARARQLGDTRDGQTGAHQIDHLVVECAYEHWHRMLFARFLAENGVLMANSEALGIENTPVTLEECEKLAADEGASNGWELAGRYASQMLPQIFRPGAPVLAVHLPPERQRRLERILAVVDPETFKASDALGWVYQFWQAKKKSEVNASGIDIGADELPSVTQLFTDPYMVSFVVHNTIGAWWAHRVLADNPTLAREAQNEESLRGACRLPGQSWSHLRFVREGERWRPAIRSSHSWPSTLAGFRVLDPCCGSGHFLVAVFTALVAVRSQTEEISVQEAVTEVLHKNIAGLDIDRRVTEIAAFALALAAWTLPGSKFGALPPLNIACSGLVPRATEKEWIALCASQDDRIANAMSALHRLFANAPTLGSLIELESVGQHSGSLKLFEGSFLEARRSLRGVLRSESAEGHGVLTSHEQAVAAQGMYEAAEILSRRYDLVLTNVPYLTHTLMGRTLREFCASAYPAAKTDLATVMQARCTKLVREGGMIATVVPSTWLTYTKYFEAFRIEQLRSLRWDLVALLGKRAFETIGGEVVDVCLYLTSKDCPQPSHRVSVVDARAERTASDKDLVITSGDLYAVDQLRCLKNPAAAFDETSQGGELLARYVTVYEGLSRGDTKRFDRCFWELPTEKMAPWRRFIESPKESGLATGRSSIFRWDEGSGDLSKHPSARVQGLEAWERPGIVISRTHMKATLSYGDAFAQNCVAIVPRDSEHLGAIWQFCQSEEYRAGVLSLNQKLIKPTGVMDKMPFDLDEWTPRVEGSITLPTSLPPSSDPTQWSFSQHNVPRERSLLIAMATLLGYRWPQEDCEELAAVIDDDGIVCIPSVRGEARAADRLLDVLSARHGGDRSTEVRDVLLAAVGAKGKDLHWWLQHKFFEQHCKIFQNRPFVWHIWDGIKKHGFSSLVNYHKLDRKLLETLTYTYLGDWIRRQQDDAARNVDGASERLDAARRLQQSLELILEGEKPYDTFVRWKPLCQQAIGWEPDLHDGVRVNIRPFMSVPDVDRKGAGVLRYKPNINWSMDGGTDPDDAPWFNLGSEYGEKRGARINDHHLSLVEKRAARERDGDRG